MAVAGTMDGFAGGLGDGVNVVAVELYAGDAVGGGAGGDFGCAADRVRSASG